VVAESEAGRVASGLETAFSDEIRRRLIDGVSCEHDMVIVAIVGEGMRGTPGIAARLFSALGDKGVNVVAVAQGSSETNLSLVLANADADQAVRYIHSAFNLADRR